MVKRSLPRSGAYDLERCFFSLDKWILIICSDKHKCSDSRYMPVFLWKEQMKRMGMDPYKELMKLVAERQNDGVVDVEEV